MRVSTNQLFDRSIGYILDNQERLADVQENVATGRALINPSDDPVGATQVIRLTEDLDQITQFQRNSTLLQNNLQQSESVLRNVNDAVLRARQLTIQAGNGVNTAQDKAAIAIEIEQLRDQVFDLMNARNADGEYIYAGYQSQSPAFTFNANPPAGQNEFQFAGDDGTTEIQVSETVRLQTSDSGRTVFEDVLARLQATITGGTAATSNVRVEQQAAFDRFHEGNYDAVTAANNNFQITILAGNQVNVTNTGTAVNFGNFNFTQGQPFNFNGLEFNVTGAVGNTVDFTLDQPQKTNFAQTLHEFSVALNDTTIGDGAFGEAVSDALVGLDNGLVALGGTNAAIGGRLNVANAVFESNLDLEIANAEARADIQDVDLAAAVSELAKQEGALTAAQSTFSRVTQLTLFDFI